MATHINKSTNRLANITRGLTELLPLGYNEEAIIFAPYFGIPHILLKKIEENQLNEETTVLAKGLENLGKILNESERILAEEPITVCSRLIRAGLEEYVKLVDARMRALGANIGDLNELSPKEFRKLFAIQSAPTT